MTAHSLTHTPAHTFTVSLNVKENLYTTTTANRECCNVSLCIQKKVSALHQLALAFIFIDISYTKKKKKRKCNVKENLNATGQKTANQQKQQQQQREQQQREKKYSTKANDLRDATATAI